MQLPVEYLLKVTVSLLCNADWFTQHSQCPESCFYHVVRISRTKRLGKNVCYTSTLKNCTHAASGDHTSTVCCRFDQHFCSAFFCKLVVRYCTMHNGNLDEILLRIFNSF